MGGGKRMKWYSWLWGQEATRPRRLNYIIVIFLLACEWINNNGKRPALDEVHTDQAPFIHCGDAANTQLCFTWSIQKKYSMLHVIKWDLGGGWQTAGSTHPLALRAPSSFFSDWYLFPICWSQHYGQMFGIQRGNDTIQVRLVPCIWKPSLSLAQARGCSGVLWEYLNLTSRTDDRHLALTSAFIFLSWFETSKVCVEVLGCTNSLIPLWRQWKTKHSFTYIHLKIYIFIIVWGNK